MKLCLRDAFASSSFNKIYTYRFSEDELGTLPAPIVSDAVYAEVTVEGQNGYVTCEIKIEGKFSVLCGRCAKVFELDFVSTTKKPVLRDDGVCDEDAVYLNSAMCFDITMAPLCKEDCKGLCPVCGCDLNTESCSCDTKTVDPRLAVLKNLFDK